MPRTKDASTTRRRSKAIPVLGAAGLTLSLASAACASPASASVAHRAAVQGDVVLADEELADVSLATFHVSDRESTAAVRARLRLAWGAGCGACGCAGCGWTGSYNVPAQGYPPWPYQAPAPAHPRKRSR